MACRTKDLWSPRTKPDNSSSDNKDVNASPMQAQQSSSTLSVLVSDSSSRQISSLSSPFTSVLPGAADGKTDAERADEDIARQLFRAAQARRMRQGAQ